MPKTCVRCGQQIKETIVRHTRRKDDTQYHFHAYDCVIAGCARLPSKENLFYRGIVLCKCGEPLITVKSSFNLEAPTNVIPTSCPSCKKSYHLSTVISSLVESQVTIATPAIEDSNITPIRIVLK